MSQFPIVLPDELSAATRDLYKRGLPPGDATGWDNLKGLYTVADQGLTVITGTPGVGKSEWLDAMSVNIAEKFGWHFSVYSPENYPSSMHMAKLVEKYTGMPFGDGPTERMSSSLLEDAMEWVHSHYQWLQPAYPNYKMLLEAAEFFRPPGSGKFGVILDPWNTLEHLREPRQSETDYVCQALTDMVNIVRRDNFHLFVVAHPTKMNRDPKTGKRPLPGPYDISGGAHWYNKPDVIICINRDQAAGTPEVAVHVQKMRFKNIGRIGEATLLYNRLTGQYRDAVQSNPDVLEF
jgi:twinkle protein